MICLARLKQVAKDALVSKALAPEPEMISCAFEGRTQPVPWFGAASPGSVSIRGDLPRGVCSGLVALQSRRGAPDLKKQKIPG